MSISEMNIILSIGHSFIPNQSREIG